MRGLLENVYHFLLAFRFAVAILRLFAAVGRFGQAKLFRFSYGEGLSKYVGLVLPCRVLGAL